jgi:hypothetical protein
MKWFFCALVLAFPVVASAENTPDTWSSFQFLLGDWKGGASGKPGEGSGEFSLKPELGGKVLVRRNHDEYPAGSGQTNIAMHDDLMIIYPAADPGSFRAEYFDSEGHVIHYVATPSPGKIVMVSNNPPTQPRFRLTYTKKPDNSLGIDFEIAPPGQDFHSYLSGTVTRK